MKHLVYIPFTGVGIPGFKGQEWLADRIQVFKDYTHKSLVAQTTHDFTLWVSWRPEERGNPLVEELDRYILDESPFLHIFTYDGLMYHDDKFGGPVPHRLWNCARLVRQAWRSGAYAALPNHLRMVLTDKNSSLRERVERTTTFLGALGVAEDSDDVLVTRIDSDDMFHRDALKKIRSYYDLKPKHWPRAILCKNGFIYDVISGILATWTPHTNPPFHTIFFKKGEFLNADTYLKVMEPYQSHEDATKFSPHVYLPDGMYCVTTRDPRQHISTTFHHPFRGKRIRNGTTKLKKLTEFGL